MSGLTRHLLLLLPLSVWAADPSPFGQFLDLGTHRVHYVCEGQGSTMVVLLPGTPRFTFHFALVQPDIARFTRVCTYDRAGDTWSEPIPNQPQAQQFVDELDQFLNRMSPQSPVVLVGHSVGGVLARAYYAQHAERISAMVLIDTDPLDSLAPTDAQLRSQADAERARPPRPLAKIQVGKPFTLLPLRYRDAHVWATEKWNAYADGVDPYVAFKYQADLYALARQAHSSTLPVWFLTRADSAKAKETWITRQATMSAAWGNSHLVRAVGSGHDIQIERPALVVKAVDEAVRLVSRPDRR